MKKKIPTIVSSLLAAFACAIALVACGDKDSHTHEYVNYEYNNDATCIADGTETAKCEHCDKTDTRKAEDHPATGEHTYIDYVCSGCGGYSHDAPVTQGLRYVKVLNDTKEIIGYSVVGIGEVVDTEIFIPETHEEKPVVRIERSAFNRCYSLTSVIIPNSVTSIADDAFCDTAYYNNESNWDNGVLYINKHLIKAKTTLAGAYTIKQGTRTIADYAFEYCSKLKSIKMPNSMTSIGKSAFEDCSSLKSINIPDSVTSIGNSAFYDCSSLTSIKIPNSVTNIGDWAFFGCSSLTIYCEAESQPSSWESAWDFPIRDVVWGYKNK